MSKRKFIIVQYTMFVFTYGLSCRNYSFVKL